MADTNTEQQIQTKVKEVLAGTPYAASSLKQLSGGTANFIYHAVLESPPPDCAEGVVLKQGESYVATQPDFPLATSRCAVEQEALVYLEALPPTKNPTSTISTPKVYFYNPDTFTQVQEYLPNAVSLKTYALDHFAAPTPESLKPQCQQLGRSLGSWLRSFHDWSSEPGHARLREIAAGNKAMQTLKTFINYQSLGGVVEQHPTILSDVKDIIQGINDMAAAEVKDEAALHVIHGDFWTGNVLLPNVKLENGNQTPVKIIDWELAQLGVRPLDLGQMIAELWQLKLYKDIDAGDWLIESFADGYGAVDDDFAFRTIIHVGVHLICFGSRTPGWGTEEQQENLVRVGKEILVKAWKKDRSGFEGHVLGNLFGKPEAT